MSFTKRRLLAIKSVVPSVLLAATLQPASAVQFKHIIFVIQENRTPDNIFGSNPTFEPGVDIGTSGITSHGKTVVLGPRPLVDCYDIQHTHAAFEDAFHEGFDKDKIAKKTRKGCVVPANGQFKYIDNSQGVVQPYFDIATGYGFANRMFQTNQGPSFIAHQFLFGGTSAPTTDSALFAAENPDNLRLPGDNPSGCISPSETRTKVIDSYGSEDSNNPVYPCFEHPTLTDVLDAHSPAIPWRYYAPMPGSIWTAPDAIQHICQPEQMGSGLVCNGPAWQNGSVVPDNPAQVLTDVQNCNLQSVSWVIPTSNESDHPLINDGSGPQWVASIVNAVGKQATCSTGENYWQDTAILITWDDWGGWFDHVRPFEVRVEKTDAKAKPKWGDGYTYGFRVPLMVVSAYTPANYVSNVKLDFGSMLYFVEQNFQLGFIGPGKTIYSNYADYQAKDRGNMMDFFSLKKPRTFVPIAVSMTPEHFLHQKPTGIGPDDY